MFVLVPPYSLGKLVLQFKKNYRNQLSFLNIYKKVILYSTVRFGFLKDMKTYYLYND